MKLRFNLFVSTLFILAISLPAFAQAVDTVIGQFTNSQAETFVGGMSGDGRFVVFESRGNLDTQNPRNADGNTEIFLWDYAQRRIFQITDTKSVLIDPTVSSTTFSNIRVEISNNRPTISTDGRYIVFSSNATTNYPGDTTNPPVVNNTNPGSFDGNAFTSPTPSPSPSGTPGANPLTHDANLEIWFYQIPSYPAVADLSAGDEQPLTYLSPVDANGSPVAGAAFFQVTNTVPSQLPRTATSTNGAFIADDNHDASISDNGQAIAFVSSRDLVPGGNTFPDIDNDEIFTFTWAGSPASGMFGQVTKTPRGTVSSPIYSKFPTISGSGMRVAYASNGENQALSSGSCVSTPPATRNEEVFYADLSATGVPTSCRQITNTTPPPNGVVNQFDAGRRMSRDGRYIAFDSYADLANENNGTNYSSFALYVYDTTLASNNFRRIGPRSDADSAASGGDAHHYPGFTDTDSNGTPSTLVLATRENIKPDGTIPSDATQGLNNDAARPVQIYAYPLNEPANTATFKRLTKFPAPNTFFASTRPVTSNSRQRIAFNLALTELGTGNQPDLLNEGYYLLVPTVTSQSQVVPTFATGASGIPVLATPTPTPTSTPTPTPTPSPSPTPQTPSAVLGLSPGMLAVLNFPAGSPQPITAKTAVGSNKRSFQLPIELSGVSLSINGVAAGLKEVGPQSIKFVVPPFLSSTTSGTTYPLVLNMNGTVIKMDMTIVPARPDLFSTTNGPGGRAIVYNVVNRVQTREPFTVNTIQIKGGRRVQTKLRLYLTGVANTTPGVISIKIGTVTISGTLIQTGGIQQEPGVYTVDFLLPPTLRGAGDQPIILTVTAAGVTFSSRLEDTAPHVTILP